MTPPPAGDAQHAAYWEALDALVAASTLVVDRPRASAHPRFPAIIYPLDYGYLAGTRGGDGDGVDVWLGAAAKRSGRLRVTAVVLTVDLGKRDAEVKLLLNCNSAEAAHIRQFHNVHQQSATLLERPIQTET